MNTVDVVKAAESAHESLSFSNVFSSSAPLGYDSEYHSQWMPKAHIRCSEAYVTVHAVPMGTVRGKRV